MKIRILLFVGLAVIAPLTPARATTLVRLGLEQLAQASTDIVRGHVVSQESRWNADHTRIITITTVAVEDCLKGHATGNLVIEQPGGTVGNFRVRVAGTALFRQDTSYLLFLEPAASDSSRSLLVGMTQGAYPIYRDATTQEERVILPLGSLTTGHSEQVESPAGTLRLTEFRRRISGAMAKPVAVPPGTSIPVTIESSESRGVGRLRVLGRTTADVYPSSTVVIPAGSPVEGTAQRVSGSWRISWTAVLIRGTRVEISAESEVPAGGSLRGRTAVFKTR